MGTISSSSKIRVLVADDDQNVRAGLGKMLQSWGIEVEMAADGQEALEKLTQAPVNVLITDLVMPRLDGFELLKRLAAQGNLPITIVLTAFGNIETAVQTIHDLGAFWFLEKPIQPSVLKALLERGATQCRLAEETERLQRRLVYQGVLADLVGASAEMQQVFSMIRQAAPSKVPVLIGGESGTGKELAARAIHQLSPRCNGPFVAINCAALPETLMESELFGHERGAFTGAVERRAGCFELANGGTLLLDELAEMPVGTQAKLLRVLEGSMVRRLGGKAEIAVDVRVIASTNKNIEDAIRKGELREDLYYRLNVFRLSLPPLRQRRSDLPLLTESLIETLNRTHGTRVVDASPEVLEQFQRYSWPGNVRELRNVLTRAVILASYGTIKAHHLPADFGAPYGSRPRWQATDPEGVRLAVGTTVSDAEKALIQLTMEHTKRNKTRAAEILGISPKTLFNKLKEYGEAEAEVAALASQQKPQRAVV